jgi:hypothetical protein
VVAALLQVPAVRRVVVGPGMVSVACLPMVPPDVRAHKALEML